MKVYIFWGGSFGSRAVSIATRRLPGVAVLLTLYFFAVCFISNTAVRVGLNGSVSGASNETSKKETVDTQLSDIRNLGFPANLVFAKLRGVLRSKRAVGRVRAHGGYIARQVNSLADCTGVDRTIFGRTKSQDQPSVFFFLFYSLPRRNKQADFCFPTLRKVSKPKCFPLSLQPTRRKRPKPFFFVGWFLFCFNYVLLGGVRF